MKTIIFKGEENAIKLTNIDDFTPIFMIKDGKVVGMLVEEDKGWIVKIGGNSGSTGYHDTREDAIKSTMTLYNTDKFVIDIEIK